MQWRYQDPLDDSVTMSFSVSKNWKPNRRMSVKTIFQRLFMKEDFISKQKFSSKWALRPSATFLVVVVSDLVVWGAEEVMSPEIMLTRFGLAC